MFKVQDLPGEQSGGLAAGDHVAFLANVEPSFDAAVVHRPVYPRVLLTDNLIAANPREHIIHELVAVVRSEVFDGATDVGQEVRRCRGTSTTLAPKGVMHAVPCSSRHP